jgi:hypothetical protein
MSVDTANGDTLAIFYAENIAAGSNTITVADTISGTLRFAIMEYTGVATANSRDVTASAQGTSPLTKSGNATTTASEICCLAPLRRPMQGPLLHRAESKSETQFPPHQTRNLSLKRRYKLQLGPPPPHLVRRILGERCWRPSRKHTHSRSEIAHPVAVRSHSRCFSIR